MLFAGEVFPVKHLRAIKALWPQPVYYNLYGPTETNVCTFAQIPEVVPDDRTDAVSDRSGVLALHAAGARRGRTRKCRAARRACCT